MVDFTYVKTVDQSRPVAGGPATNEAGEWHGRPGLARVLRFMLVTGPFIAAFSATYILSKLVPESGLWAMQMARFLFLAGSSVLVMLLVERLFRRAAPLPLLMKMTLIFPDQAPSRLAVALRSASTKELQETVNRVRRDGLGSSAQQAAETLLVLVAALSQHDRVTKGHSERVRAYADLIAEELDLTSSERSKLRWAALLHDVGKIHIPAEILNKSGKLTDPEYRIIQQHPEIGDEMVEPLKEWLGDFAGTILEHHERWDGGGYPNGIAGQNICLGARVVAVADTFDVITSIRSYKKAAPAAEARAEILRCSGAQFDPEVVKAFMRIGIGGFRWKMAPLSVMASVPHMGFLLQGGRTAIQIAAPAGSTGGAMAIGGASSGMASVSAAVVVVGAGSVASPPPMEMMDILPFDVEGETFGDLAADGFTETLQGDDGEVEVLFETIDGVVSTTVTLLRNTGSTSTSVSQTVTSTTSVPPTSPTSTTSVLTRPTSVVSTAAVRPATTKPTVPPDSSSTTTTTQPTTTPAPNTTAAPSTTTTQPTTTTTTTTAPPEVDDGLQGIANCIGQASLTARQLRQIPTVDLSGCDLSGADFSGLNLDGLKIQHGHLPGADFSGASLEDATFNHSDLTGASFAGATLTRADFDRSTISGANFHNARLFDTDFKSITAVNAVLTVDSGLASGLGWSDAHVRDSDFSGADFSNRVIANLSVEKSIFSGTNFTRTTWNGVDFSDKKNKRSDLSGAVFAEASLADVKLKKATIVGTVFSPVSWVDVDLKGALGVPSVTNVVVDGSKCPNGDDAASGSGFAVCDWNDN